MSENPFPTELPSLLTRVLLAIEGIRRGDEPSPADWDEAESELDTFAGLQENLSPPEIADEVASRIEEARVALSARDADAAREALLGVGRAFDEWVRGGHHL